MKPRLMLSENGNFSDQELELAEAQYAEELAQAEADLKAELETGLIGDIKTTPELVSLDIQLQVVREEILRDKAILAHKENARTKMLEERRANSTLSRLKVKMRANIAPVLLGLGVSVVTVPAAATFSWLNMDNEDRLDSKAQNDSRQRSLDLDGKESRLDGDTKYLLNYYSDKPFALVKYLENRKGLAQPSGATIFSHILDNGRANYESFPEYGFDIRELEKPLSLEQMQRALDVYEKLPEDARTFRGLIKSLVLDVYLEDFAAQESTEAVDQDFVKRLKDTIDCTVTKDKADDDKIINIVDKK